MGRKKNYKINYDNIPVLAIGFTRATNIVARAIQLVRGILNKPDLPNHAFIVTSDRGQKFATEQTIRGLEVKSLEQYAYKNNKIVAVYFWQSRENETWVSEAQDFLALVRRRSLENSKYDIIGLLSFLPVLNKFVKPDKNKEWCSENVAGILKHFGATFITKKEIAPDELLIKMQKSNECIEIRGYYE